MLTLVNTFRLSQVKIAPNDSSPHDVYVGRYLCRPLYALWATDDVLFQAFGFWANHHTQVIAALCTGGDRLNRAEGDNLLGPLRNLR
jgi:hypothetical protein